MLFVSGGYIPKDAPSPVIQHHKPAETAIAAFTTAVGILSTIFFLLFNICCHKHQYVCLIVISTSGGAHILIQYTHHMSTVQLV